MRNIIIFLTAALGIFMLINGAEAGYNRVQKYISHINSPTSSGRSRPRHSASGGLEEPSGYTSTPFAPSRLREGSAYQSDFAPSRLRGPTRSERNARTDYDSDTGDNREIELRELNPFWQAHLGQFALPSEIQSFDIDATRPATQSSREHQQPLPAAATSSRPSSRPPLPTLDHYVARPLRVGPHVVTSESDEEYMMRKPSARIAMEFARSGIMAAGHLPHPHRGDEPSASEDNYLVDEHGGHSRSRSRSSARDLKTAIDASGSRRPLHRSANLRSSTVKPNSSESAYEEANSEFYPSSASPSMSPPHVHSKSYGTANSRGKSKQEQGSRPPRLQSTSSDYGKDVYVVGGDAAPSSLEREPVRFGLSPLFSPPNRLQHPQPSPQDRTLPYAPSDLDRYFTTDDGEVVTRKQDRIDPKNFDGQFNMPPQASDIAQHGVPRPWLYGKSREEIARDLAVEEPETNPVISPHRPLTTWDLLPLNDPQRQRHEEELSAFEKEWHKHNVKMSPVMARCRCILETADKIPVIDLALSMGAACGFTMGVLKKCLVPKAIRNPLYDCLDRAGQRAWDESDPRYVERKQSQLAHLERLEDLAEAWHDEWMQRYLRECEEGERRHHELQYSRSAASAGRVSSSPGTPLVSEWPQQFKPFRAPHQQAMTRSDEAEPHPANGEVSKPNTPVSSRYAYESSTSHGGARRHPPLPISESVRDWAEKGKEDAGAAMATTPSDSDLAEAAYRSRQKMRQLRASRFKSSR